MSLSDEKFPPPKFGEPYLLTPGPLTTAYEVKEAMLKDWGSWDEDFRDLTKKLRKNLFKAEWHGKDGARPCDEFWLTFVEIGASEKFYAM